jgi:hypothetical protein
VRDTTVFNHLLAFPGVWVTAVEFGTGAVTVDVRLKRRRLKCPHCAAVAAAASATTSWTKRSSTG